LQNIWWIRPLANTVIIIAIVVAARRQHGRGIRDGDGDGDKGGDRDRGGDRDGGSASAARAKRAIELVSKRPL